MRSLVPWLSLIVLAVGCRGPAPKPASGERAPPPVQLQTSVSVDASTVTALQLVSGEGPVLAQMALARGLALRADARFLSAVKGRVPFPVTKKPWRERPCIELSLREVLVERAKEGSGEPDRVKVQVGLRADLPDVGVSIDRNLTYERELPAPLEERTAEASLAPAVEEAAALAADWLVEAVLRPPAGAKNSREGTDAGEGSGEAAPRNP